MEFNFRTICQNSLLHGLPSRTQDVLSRRFGLAGKKETLEEIGQSYGVTRERVRQIENDGFGRLAEVVETPQCQKIFVSFAQEIKKGGSLMKEETLLAKLGGEEFKNHVSFLLTLGKPFQRFSETEDTYAFWSTDKTSVFTARRAIDSFVQELKRKGELLPLPKNIPASYIEVSKNIMKNNDGLYGLKEWPEVNPRGVKDKAYIVLKKEQKPLHFTEVADLIGEGTLCQTVHNELIKDQRFVLVGRGLYALKEWGYEPGIVRDVITSVLKTSAKPLDKDEVLQKVLKQRYVKANTVLLNLQNRKHFQKTSEGKYTVREV
jgi:hypothetical protein